jgi:N-methylhydantoinase A
VAIVNVRVRAVGRVAPPPITINPGRGAEDVEHALIDEREVLFSARPVRTPFYRGETLQPGDTITGPAIVIRDDTTILIGTSDQASVDGYLNVLIKIGDLR